MNRIHKNKYLNQTVEHIDITTFDATNIIEAMGKMSFTAREVARGVDIYKKMLLDPDCTIILTIAGSTGAAGCMKIYADMVKYNLVDVIVATGASIVDMDFFEALGHRHYIGTQHVDDAILRKLHIDRIYDTFIDEDALQQCDATIKSIADASPARPFSSREFIDRMGAYLETNAKKQESFVALAHQNRLPIFCPAFSDSSAGFGLAMHQHERGKTPCLSIDSVKDFRELTEIKMRADVSGLFMIGGGVPKNFAQDTVVCAELLGKPVPMHTYAVQITVADVRDGACSSSTLKEAFSWGKVDTAFEQMIFAEATSVLPLIVSYLFHSGLWRGRQRRAWAELFD